MDFGQRQSVKNTSREIQTGYNQDEKKDTGPWQSGRGTYRESPTDYNQYEKKDTGPWQSGRGTYRESPTGYNQYRNYIQQGFDYFNNFMCAPGKRSLGRARPTGDNRENDEWYHVSKYELLPNIQFYKNEIPAKPNRECIEEILSKWIGNYEKLRTNRSYIQWLFPNRYAGKNKHASALTDEEAEFISSNPELKDKVKKAFVMMLDFYGMRLTEDDQFELENNSEKRLKELNTQGNKSFLEITRILLALKDLGHKHLMLPWIKFLANLIYKKKTLNHAKDSFEEFWIYTLDPEERALLYEYNNTELVDMVTPKHYIPDTMNHNIPAE